MSDIKRWQVIKLSEGTYAAHGILIEGPRCEDETLVPLAEVEALRQQLAGAVSDEAARRFRDALAPGYVVWHDGKRLSPEDTLTQIKRGLLAAFDANNFSRGARS